MLLDVMSSYNYIPVNTKAIKIFGLPCATYWAVLSDIYPRVVTKKLNELMTDGYFTVDRSYVESKSGLTSEEQYACDLGLSQAGVVIINPSNPDMIGISMDAMFAILAEDDAKVLDQIRKKAKTKKTDEAAAKRRGKIATFTAFTSTLSHTPEVQEAYKLWVESIIEGKKGNLTKGVIQIFHDTLTEFTTDPVYQVKLIREAAASGYTNLSWVINSQRRAPGTVSTYSTPGTRINVPQKTFVGVDETTTF